MRIAIYDLDRTITRRPTFTPFLIYAASALTTWRVALAPVWIVLMIGYRFGLYDRTTLKRLGMRLLIGTVPLDKLDRVSARFASHRIARSGLQSNVVQMIENDRRAGARIVMATAAFEFYAWYFARAVGIEEVIATRWDGQGIPGGNCYGLVKRERILTWMEQEGLEKENARIRVVSDSFADAPTFALADEPIFVSTSDRSTARALLKGWTVVPAAR
ncbi:haloacid dehalogenase-like hydrolase [Tsuneonella dongtanensis]|uniref:Haloacid dehalogenase-like hydrolase n=1 Tax=Tsuneonella dongtanensis TaxID=692370 RepID=A0A1B2AF93_9SPHN|nr:haloacid dehalogenase-like hydrolase [Tsuneonella dongtanensis]ANY20768.1 haloacid dehalogenase-like hydrolase [Tsuneonella dongtanensis]